MSNPSDAFRRMAEAIDHNLGKPFGGAMVVLPPVEGGEAIEMLIIDSSQDPAMFWSSLKTKAEMALAELTLKERQGPRVY